MAAEGRIAMLGDNDGLYLTVDREDFYEDEAAEASGCTIKKVGRW